MPRPFNSLTRDEKIKHWQGTEARINGVLELCAERISTGTREEVSEYLEHNELGLAWETLCQVLVELDEVPSESARRLILEAGERMGFNQPENPNHEQWKSIKALTYHGG